MAGSSGNHEQTGRLTGHLAPEGFLEPLLEELGDRVRAVHGRLVLVEGRTQAVWAQNTWYEAQRVRIRSVADAARRLHALQRNWVAYSFDLHRRTALIAAALPSVSARPLEFRQLHPGAAQRRGPEFGADLPRAPLGSFTLLERDVLLAAPRCSSPFPHGEARFVEDRQAPPSRAYLKLWEALTLLGRRPAPGELCLDLGSSPGGWTWALQGLGARVLSVDKAPLDERVAALPGVTFRCESAFGLRPSTVGPVDWIFADVVCYPPRLLELVQRWLASGLCRRFVCTLKFQGRTDHETVRRFGEIPGSRLVHLFHNKHELTWMLA